MNYQWDEDKNAQNLAKHGIAFESVYEFNWQDALVFEDTRHEYGEIRQIALGFIAGRLHVCISSDRDTERRVISLRKANNREVRMYNDR